MKQISPPSITNTPRKKAFSFLLPAPHVAPLPEATAARKYPRLGWQILEATFIGYATFYLVRNNLPVVSKEVGSVLGYDKAQIGDMLAATAISYGLGKFLLGSLSDRSNPRYFMALGLLLTALCNFLFGSVQGYYLHLFLWALNGFVQGMGWDGDRADTRSDIGTAYANAERRSHSGTSHTTLAAV